MFKLTRYPFARAALFATILAITAPALANAYTGTATDDTSIYQAARKTVMPYDIFFNKVNVSVQNGLVTLSGHVDNWKQSKEVEKQVAELPGVVKVRNDLLIKDSRGK